MAGPPVVILMAQPRYKRNQAASGVVSSVLAKAGMDRMSKEFTKSGGGDNLVMRLSAMTCDVHHIHRETLSRADRGRVRASAALDVVCVSADRLRDLVAEAVREGFTRLNRPQAELDGVVSLDQAAKLLRRRRSVVLQSVLAGVIPAELVISGKRRIWRIRVADLHRMDPGMLAAIESRSRLDAEAGGR